MTSLTGCTHEQFETVLVSLGYEKFQAPAPPGKAVAPSTMDAPPVLEPPSEEAAVEAAIEGTSAEGSVAVASSEPAQGASIELWRPAQRRRHHQHHHNRGRANKPKPEPRVWEIPAPRPPQPPQPRRPPPAEAAPAPSDKKPRRDERRERPRVESPPPKPRAVDPDSPFYKLMALKEAMKKN
jgi:hypothetical protein